MDIYHIGHSIIHNSAQDFRSSFYHICLGIIFHICVRSNDVSWQSGPVRCLFAYARDRRVSAC
jgi:hypothetical protein